MSVSAKFHDFMHTLLLLGGYTKARNGAERTEVNGRGGLYSNYTYVAVKTKINYHKIDSIH